MISRTRAAGISVFMACVLVWCSAFSCASAIQKLQTYVPIGIDAFDGAINIISPVPGSPLQVDKALVDGLWASLSAAMTAYQTAPAASKATKLQELIVAIQAVSTGIGKTLSDFGVSGPIDDGVQAALLLIQTTLQSIASSLAPSTTTAAKPPARTVKVKDTTFVLNGDPSKFVKQYNAIMLAGGHPDHQLK